MTPGELPEGAALSAWIRAARPPRPALGATAGEPDPFRANAAFLEVERAADGHPARTATLLLRNRECPWQCLMCDLWKHTLPGPTPAGAVPAQIDAALTGLGHPLGDAPEQIKLYNSGSFFDPRAVPTDEYTVICARLAAVRHVVVESHPRLVGHDTGVLADALSQVGATLEVALGLETSHPEVLRRLNKRVTLDDFTRAAEVLQSRGAALRCFALVRPPFLDETESLAWALHTVDTALSLGASVVSLIATRAGNGAMERLAEAGLWAPPALSTLERALSGGQARARARSPARPARIFADTWDLGHTAACAVCFEARCARLQAMNLTQQPAPRIECATCGGGAG